MKVYIVTIVLNEHGIDYAIDNVCVKPFFKREAAYDFIRNWHKEGFDNEDDTEFNDFMGCGIRLKTIVDNNHNFYAFYITEEEVEE